MATRDEVAECLTLGFNIDGGASLSALSAAMENACPNHMNYRWLYYLGL